MCARGVQAPTEVSVGGTKARIRTGLGAGARKQNSGILRRFQRLGAVGYLPRSMPARILKPDATGLAEAVRVLRAGGLVAFPTETVYGLGAHALDVRAVERIFAAKGRPPDNPLIVHVASVESAKDLAASWSSQAEALSRAHWPGPLTLVVEKAAQVPDRVTAGGPTVAIRVPNHGVALALLRESGLPIAAPSANRSEQVSPTRAQHVVDSLGPYVDDLLVLDGGPCAVGIESTVVDATAAPFRVLRPGMLDLIPHSPRGDAQTTKPTEVMRSPGQRERHYAPSKPLHIVDAEWVADAHGRPGDYLMVLDKDPQKAGASLYAELRRLEAEPGIERILVRWPPDEPAWAAIRDRLRRAASD